MNRGPNIFDYLEGTGDCLSLSDPNRTEEANLVTLRQDIAGERIDFAFLVLAGLDACCTWWENSPRRSSEAQGLRRVD